jgi:hypothetical protein
MLHKVDVKSSRFMKLAEPNFDGCSRTKSWNRTESRNAVVLDAVVKDCTRSNKG